MEQIPQNSRSGNKSESISHHVFQAGSYLSRHFFLAGLVCHNPFFNNLHKHYTDLTDGSGQIIVTAMNKVSEKELLASVEKLEIKISQLIQEKEKLSSENQTLSKKNEELIQAVQSLESLKDQARVKAENVLRRLDEIEPLA